jgi:parvin
LQVVKKSLVTFVNKHLNKINLEVTELETQFADGVYLCLLAGLLEGYFVPLYDFHLTPQVIPVVILSKCFAYSMAGPMDDFQLPVTTRSFFPPQVVVPVICL